MECEVVNRNVYDGPRENSSFDCKSKRKGFRDDAEDEPRRTAKLDSRGGCPHMKSEPTKNDVRPPYTYSPPTVRPSMRIVGAATEPRNSRSLPISEIF